jgi:predicted  nucleic acid-binding Zn-ribbon protein
MKMMIPVSVGELIDKITILEIKVFLTDDEYVHKELNELNKIKSTLTQYTLDYEVQLKKVNEDLWKIEDKLRKLEKEQKFDDEFIDLARSVYIKNDERARIKKEINIVCNSDYQEIKIY